MSSQKVYRKFNYRQPPERKAGRVSGLVTDKHEDNEEVISRGARPMPLPAPVIRAVGGVLKFMGYRS